MALITCPDCGSQVSDKAKACIHCGCPLTVEQGKLIIRGKRYTDGLYKHIYFLYDERGNFFDEVLPGEVKHYAVDKPITLVLGHKRGGFLFCAVKDSTPVRVEPNCTTRLEASVGTGVLPHYFLSKVDVIDAD